MDMVSSPPRSHCQSEHHRYSIDTTANIKAGALPPVVPAIETQSLLEPSLQLSGIDSRY
jgi:hypothetical protein